MSRFRGFLIGMMVGLGVGLAAVVVVVAISLKLSKDAANVIGAEAVAPNLPRPAPPDFPRPAPPLLWPTYDAGPMRPGEHLFELITADDKGIYSRNIDLLPKLLGSDHIPPPPSPDAPPPPSPHKVANTAPDSFPAPDHK